MTPMANHKTAMQEKTQYWIGVFKNGFMLKSSESNIEKLHDMNLKSIADIKRSMNAALFFRQIRQIAPIMPLPKRKNPAQAGLFVVTSELSP